MSNRDCNLSREDHFLKGIEELIGCQISDIGLLTEDSPEGGLAIDYIQDNQEKRIILGFTELGMWVDWQGEKGKLNDIDILSNELKNMFETYDLMISGGFDGGIIFWKTPGTEERNEVIFNATELADGFEIEYIIDDNKGKFVILNKVVEFFGEHVLELWQQEQKNWHRIIDLLYLCR